MERCRFAFRKPGKAGVFCKNMPDKTMDYCAKQVPCRDTGRWEAASCLVEHCDWFDPKFMNQMNAGTEETEQKSAKKTAKKSE